MGVRMTVACAERSPEDLQALVDEMTADLNQLQGAEAAAESAAAPEGGVYDEVVLLKNQTSQKVCVQLSRALRGAAKDDQVLIYFSGHGKLDATGRLCLTMTDTVLDALESSALRVAELKDFLDVSRCKNVMLSLDCCYSGEATR